jgi:hypothetical protein
MKIVENKIPYAARDRALGMGNSKGIIRYFLNLSVRETQPHEIQA